MNLVRSECLDVLFVCVQLIDAPDVVAATVLSNFIESCVWRITEFDFQTVEQAILSFNFSLEITSIYTVDIMMILGELFNLSCPGQPICSGHGSCIDAFCVCDAGYLIFCFVFGSHLAAVFVFTFAFLIPLCINAKHSCCYLHNLNKVNKFTVLLSNLCCFYDIWLLSASA